MLALVISLFASASFANSAMDDEVPIVLREPAAAAVFENVPLGGTARIQAIIDNKTLRATSMANDWYIGEVIAVESQTAGIGIVGFVEVTGIENKQDGTYELTAELVRQSRMNFFQLGDQAFHLDLSSENTRYKGTTDLIIKKGSKDISSKYKPLFTQGLAVGETAETLWENEYMITWFGQVNYGWKEWLTVSSIIPANFVGAANASFKARVHESASNIAAVGVSATRIPKDETTSVNLNVYWDSISSESVVSHTFLSLNLLSFSDSEDTTAIKSLGSSSLQSGYEFIMADWNRVLLGPSYNFEKKSVGGYLTYVKIWDKFHLSLSVNATDITSLKLSATDGYFMLFDAYWRF